MNKDILRVKIFPLSSIIKMLFVGLIVPFGIFGVVCGIFGMFGYNTVTLNGENVYGFTALISGLAIGIILPLIMAVFLGFFTWLGLRIFCKFKALNLTLFLDKKTNNSI